MDWKNFFKPTKWTIGLFIFLVISSYLFFAYTGIEIFACKTQPVYHNPPEFQENTCGLGIYVMGVRQIFTPFGYFMIALMLLILPYLLACMMNFLIKRK